MRKQGKRMINTIIKEYLTDHKRLVIPSFGAFVKKEGEGIVVFMEFLKKDDGVLAGLVAARMSAGMNEALEAIDRYVVSVKAAVEKSGGFVIPGVGTLCVNGDGFYALDYKTYAAPAPSAVRPAKPEVAAPQPVRETSAVKEPAVARPTPRPAVPQESLSGTKSGAVQAQAPAVTPSAAEKAAERVVRPRGEAPRPEAGEQAPVAAGTDVPVSKHEGRGTLDAIIDSQNSQSAAKSSDGRSEVKGLKYAGDGVKTVGRSRPGRKVDKVMIVAVLAALVAIAAMVYGVMSDPGPEFVLGEEQPVETEMQQTAE